MLKITSDNEVTYILTEAERVSLASQKAKDFIKEKFKNIEKYVVKDNKAICFFTDVPVYDENIALEGQNVGCYFNVNMDNKMYNCMYAVDIKNKSLGEIEKEALYLLLWRHDVGGGYVETIGDYYIEPEGYVFTPESTPYNECVEYQKKYNTKENSTIEEIKLNHTNREKIRKIILSL